MRIRTTTCTAASALLCLSALSVTPAQATAIQSQTFTSTNSLTDTPGGGATQHVDHTFANLTFNKFDTSLGVLTAVKLVLTSTRSQTTVLSGTPPTGTGTRRNTAANTVTNTHFAAPGINASLATIQQNPSCGAGGTGAIACPRTVGPANTTTNASYNGTLSNYVGPGTFSTTLKANVSATDSVSGGTWTNPSDAYTAGWSGSVDVKYSYQQHSNASFNSSSVDNNVLNLDFGKVQQGSHVTPMLFDIFNMLVTDTNADGRLALNYNPSLISSSGDLTAFSLNTWFSSVSDLAAGKSVPFSIKIDSSHDGIFSAVYMIGFSDSTDINGIGYANNYLTLNVTGEVVPEPASLACLGGGILLLGAFGLRRRNALKV
jgi:hypothetical protein